MKLWHVITPEYPYTEVVCAYGGPTYDVQDVIAIEAETKRDAIALGVREMLKGGHVGGLRYSRYEYCLAQRSDGRCPYSGVSAEEVHP